MYIGFISHEFLSSADTPLIFRVPDFCVQVNPADFLKIKTFYTNFKQNNVMYLPTYYIQIIKVEIFHHI